MSYGTHKLAFLLKSFDGQPVLPSTCYLLVGNRIEERWVEDFSSADKIVTSGLTDGSIAPNAQSLVFEELNRFETDVLFVRISSFCHDSDAAQQVQADGCVATQAPPLSLIRAACSAHARANNYSANHYAVDLLELLCYVR